MKGASSLFVFCFVFSFSRDPTYSLESFFQGRSQRRGQGRRGLERQDTLPLDPRHRLLRPRRLRRRRKRRRRAGQAGADPELPARARGLCVQRRLVTEASGFPRCFQRAFLGWLSGCCVFSLLKDNNNNTFFGVLFDFAVFSGWVSEFNPQTFTFTLWFPAIPLSAFGFFVCFCGVSTHQALFVSGRSLRLSTFSFVLPGFSRTFRPHVLSRHFSTRKRRGHQVDGLGLRRRLRAVRLRAAVGGLRCGLRLVG